MSEKLILGKDTIFDTNDPNNNNHTCVFGGSGSGKSYSIVKPNILSFSDYASSIVVSDPKGRLEQEHAYELQKKGYKVYSIDLINPERSSCTFNLFSYITKEIDFVKIAHRIVYADPMTKTSTNDVFWLHQAEIMLSAILGLVIMIEKTGEDTLDKVMYYLSNLNADGTGLTNGLMENVSRVRGDTLVAKQWAKIKGLMGSEKTFYSVLASAQEPLGRYESEEMQCFFKKKKNIDFDSFAKQKSVLFLKVSDTNDTYYNFANLIYAQAIESIFEYADKTKSGMCPIPVRFILDDFSTNVLIESMPRIISTARARNVSFMLICQSIRQLEAGYGKDAQTIISNCDNIVFMSSNDLATCEEFGKRLDLPVCDLLYKDRDKIYIFRSGQKPVEDKRYDYKLYKEHKQLER